MNLVVKHTEDKQYDLLVQQISSLVSNAKKQVATAINNTLVETYWHIGKYIVEFEQDGKTKAKYGDRLLVNLSKDLTATFGKGYSKSNLFNMRLFYNRIPIFQTVSGKLSWSHIIELVNIDNELERNFYLEDIGQMNLYLGYFAIDKNNEGDKPPIGIILAKEKDEVMVQYAMYGNNNNLFVSKYQFYLPDLDELRNWVFKSLK
jgi:hypothetical protein